MAESTGDLAVLQARRSQVIALLAAAPTGPYIEDEGGRRVDLVKYRKSLTDELTFLNSQIPIAAGPWDTYA